MSYSLQKLPGGLRLLTVPRADTQAVTMSVFVKVGSRYEKQAVNGASHFLEHLMFKGTKRRPSSFAITKELDAVGAQYNAFTSKDVTCYYVKINAQHTDLAADILSDMLINSTFVPAEIERERGAILEEISMYEDNPVMAIGDMAEEVLYGKHHPLGWSILGPRHGIRTMSRAKLLAYKREHYHAGNMLVVLSGKIPAQPEKFVQKYFRNLPRRTKKTPYLPYRTKTASSVLVKPQKVEQVQLALSVPAFAYQDKRLPATILLSNILGGTMSSRLFLEVREKRGLAYRIRSGVGVYEDTGSFEVSAGVDQKNVETALRVILDELRKISAKPVSLLELKRAKENIHGSMILDFEDSEELGAFYARQTLFGKKVLSPDEAWKRFAAVTPSDIQAIARRLFRPTAYRLAMVGQVPHDTRWTKLIRRS